MFTKYILLWLPMVVIGIANGALREVLVSETMSEALAHQLSTVTLFVFLGAYIWFILPKSGIHSKQESWGAGAIWLILTVFFEFGLGFVSGQTMQELLNAYNLFEGRLWIIIPVWVGVAPRIFFSFSNDLEGGLKK
jgi:hypothetical protein